MSKNKSLEEYIIDATDNIQKDRDAASRLLQDLMGEMANNTDKYKHRNFGETASRYLETLQRSNEQLVKLAALVQKREPKQQGFSDKEKDSIFDLIMDEKMNG
jgi:uncharacterized protein YukE